MTPNQKVSSSIIDVEGITTAANSSCSKNTVITEILDDTTINASTTTSSLSDPLLVPMNEQQIEPETDGNINIPVTAESTTASTTSIILSSEVIQVQQQQQQQQRTIWRCCRKNDSNGSRRSTSTGNINHKKNILAFASTTNCIATIIIPLCIIGTHILFLYGQTSDMWSLLLYRNMDVSYNVKSYESRITFNALHLPTSYNYNIHNNNYIVRTFTYIYAMQELWYAKHMPGLVLPRIASFGLFLFSGIWPHLKLLLLHIVWFTPYTNNIRRQRTLSYLSILGKWSLVDVLVVCVMVGVLHLQYTFTTQHVMEQVKTHLPSLVALVHTIYSAEDLCTIALKYSCSTAKRVDHIVECKACRSTINTWFDHPESVHDILQGIDTDGGGQVQLSVVGLHGIYAFCGAVIVSILLSFIVDYYDFKCRTDNNCESNIVVNQQNNNNIPIDTENRLPVEQPLNIEVANVEEDSDEAILNQLLLVQNGGHNVNHNNHDIQVTTIDTRSIADREFDRNIRIENQRTTHIIWQGISYITLLIVIGATISITMERRVYGAIPKLLIDVLDVVWTKQYNFIWLAYTTALAGRWDYLLMSTFVWFIIAGPILRAILCVIANRYNETITMSNAKVIALYRTKRKLSIWIDFIGAFCAWEVFIVAVLMVDLLMPSITSTILIDPRCAQLTSLLTMNGVNDNIDTNRSSTCFEVEFDIIKKAFWAVIVGGILLLLVSQHVRNNLQRTEA